MRTTQGWAVLLCCWVLGAGGCSGEQEDTGVGAPCAGAADCAALANDCRTDGRCEASRCVFTSTAEGTPLSAQVEGDCALAVCDGQGGIKLNPLAADVPDDGDVCTLDTCDGTSPRHDRMAEVACYTGPAGTEG